MPTELKPARSQTSSGVSSGTAVETGFSAYIRAVYNYMAGGLALTGAVAYVAFTTGFYLAIARTPMIWLVLLAPLVMVMFLSFGIQRMSLAAAQISYWAYSALMGLSLAGIFLMYSGQDISRVFFITAGTFGAMSVYGYTTRRDLTGWGSFFFMGLIGVMLASLVNLFLKSSALQFAVSVMGVMVFVGLTAFDTQKIKSLYFAMDARDVAGKKIVMGALTLYLDFINLFLMLLRLLGGRRN